MENSAGRVSDPVDADVGVYLRWDEAEDSVGEGGGMTGKDWGEVIVGSIAGALWMWMLIVVVLGGLR